MNPGTLTPEPSGGPPREEVDAALFDYAQLRRQIVLVAKAIRRHRGIFAAVVVGLTTAITVLAVMWPKTYHVQTKILAQRNQVLASLSNPRRAMPLEADAPTRAVSETVLRRDNLVSLVKQTNLVDNWQATRPTLLRIKDKLTSIFVGQESDEDRLDNLALLLERRLTVTTAEGTVTIGIDWPNGPMAYQLIEAAQQNFLEARHVSEVSSIEEAISILESHADNVHESIERTLEEIQKMQAAPAPKPVPAADGAAPQPAKRPVSLTLGEPQPEQELQQIKFLLRAKQRAIADLEDFRQKRLSELQAQLAEQKVVYSDQHPVIKDTMQRIAALNQDSPQILALRQDEQDLMAEYRRRGGHSLDAPVEPTRTVVRTDPPKSPSTSSGPKEESAQLVYMRQQLRIATDTYQDILLRIDAARIELDTARAAFKYRYSVVNPARLPKHPEKPNVPVVIFAGFIVSLIFGVAAALAWDMRKGAFMEGWQIEQVLALPLIAEVRQP